MATRPEDIDLNAPEHDDPQLEDEAEGEGAPNEATEGEGDELTLAIDGEDDGGEENDLIRRLRYDLRTTKGELAAERKAKQAPFVEVGKKPDLWEDCEGDPDKFESALTAYHDRRRANEQRETDARTASEAQTREFEKLRGRHQQRASALGIKDFDKLEQSVVEAIGPDLTGALLVMSDDSAKLVAALGTHPAALQRIVDEPNQLIKLKIAMDLERKIVVNKRRPPAPEAHTIVRGTAPATANQGDKKLEKLRADAQKSGDFTALSAYKAQQRQAGRK